jgi:predicted small integral membrane protein
MASLNWELFIEMWQGTSGVIDSRKGPAELYHRYQIMINNFVPTKHCLWQKALLLVSGTR